MSKWVGHLCLKWVGQLWQSKLLCFGGKCSKNDWSSGEYLFGSLHDHRLEKNAFSTILF